MDASLPAAGKKRLAGLVSPRLLLLGLLLAALAAGAWAWHTHHGIESTDDAALRADAVALAPKVPGYVAEVLVRPNEAVRKGQVLVRLERRNFELELQQAAAAVQARVADRQRSENDAEVSRSQIEQARNQLQLAELALRHSRGEFDRYAPLAEQGIVSRERIGELRLGLQQDEARLKATRIELDAALKREGASRSAIAQAKAQVEAAQANQQQQARQVDETTLLSPMDGRVGDATVQVGQLVQPGTRLMSVVPMGALYVVANFKETQIRQMREGQPVRVQVDAFPSEPLSGAVESFAPGTGSQFALLPAENATGNFVKVVQRVPVRIRVVDMPEAMRQRLVPGLSVTVDVNTRNASQ